MTLVRVFRCVEGVNRLMVTRQTPRQRVWARVSSYDHQILKLSRSGDDKAVLAAYVVGIRVGSRESAATSVIVPGAVVHVWWCMRMSLEVGFLVFGRDMSWSTSVLLVSSGKGLMCTDLIS